MQRIFDIILSAMALVVLSPLLLPIAIILRMTGEGKVFYVQQRIGMEQRPFGLLKFATMLENSPSMRNGAITVRNDPRVLPFGRFLRKTKINELPQLINILKGEMSIIGPRPMIVSTFENYPTETRNIISQVKPGLSGVGSIVFRDEESMMSQLKIDKDIFYRECILPYKGDLEVWYVKNKTIWVYLLLICLTVWIIIFPGSEIYKRLLVDLPAPSICLDNKEENV